MSRPGTAPDGPPVQIEFRHPATVPSRSASSWRARVQQFRVGFGQLDVAPRPREHIADLVAESQKLAAHLRCSGTHLRQWTGHPPAGRRSQDIDVVSIFRVSGGNWRAFEVEDNLTKMRQLGLST